MPLFLFNRINLYISFSFITFVLSKLNDRRSIMKERRMEINKGKFERLLQAAAPYIMEVMNIPHINELEYGHWYDGKDTRLYTINSWTDRVEYYNVNRILNELPENKIQDIINWAMNRINPIKE